MANEKFSGKIKEEGTYKAGKKNGHWTAWTPYGFKDSEGDYKDERPNGLWTYYYETGVKSMEQNYKDGKLVGDCKAWYENAKLKTKNEEIANANTPITTRGAVTSATSVLYGTAFLKIR